jgi:MoxR-like ATPase
MQADLSATVPDKDPTYVPFGNYTDIESIIRSKIFFPVYVTGLSGNGKTMSIAQACAKLKRELVRINVTEETDELDLLGGTELVDGSTVNREGAVLLAMRRGAVLLIDEGDLNNGKILCLMPILEGKPYLNKKTGEVIHPAPGFNVFITGNTKGKGSEDGRFIGTKVMNEAFLERFAITMEQEYPSPVIEKKIVLKNMEQVGTVDDDFATKLCTWSEIIRKSFFEGAVDEIITTRRLVHIVKTQAIFKDRLKSLNLALNRFDTETKTSFLDLYTKVDASVNPQQPTNTVSASSPEASPEVRTMTDPNTGNFIVESHGRRTEISQHTLLSSTTPLEDMISKIVLEHASNPVNTVAQDTVPF